MLKNYAVIIVFGFLFSGCLSSGTAPLKRETVGTLENKLIKGKTTRKEVEGIWGNPQSIDKLRETGGERWNYYHTKSTLNSHQIVNLLITFNHEGVMTDYVLDKSKRKCGFWGGCKEVPLDTK